LTPESADIAAPARIEIPADDLTRLRDGELIVHLNEGSGGTGMMVSDAPVAAVWRVIVDYDHYVDFLPYVTGSRVDSHEYHDDHEQVDSTIELTTRGIVTEYSIRNEVWKDAGWMGFVMLPKPGNPLKDVIGWWRVEEFDGAADRTLVTYSIDATADWWVPAWVRNRATDNAVPRTTRLVAERAEKLTGP
jgi:ribosome-associated toxin RatA of RatAB toxin-antitoxin module